MSDQYKFDKYVNKIKNTNDKKSIRTYVQKLNQYSQKGGGAGWDDAIDRSRDKINKLSGLIAATNEFDSVNAESIQANYTEIVEALKKSFKLIHDIDTTLGSWSTDAQKLEQIKKLSESVKDLKTADDIWKNETETPILTLEETTEQQTPQQTAQQTGGKRRKIAYV